MSAVADWTDGMEEALQLLDVGMSEDTWRSELGDDGWTPEEAEQIVAELRRRIEPPPPGADWLTTVQQNEIPLKRALKRVADILGAAGAGDPIDSLTVQIDGTPLSLRWRREDDDR